MTWKKIDYIVCILEDGPQSTREIYDCFLDRWPKKCPTMYELALLCRRSKEVEKHTPAHNQRSKEVDGWLSRWLGHTVWRLKEEVV